MNNQLVWQDRFNIGVDLIDKEHKKLFRIINRLFALMEQEEKNPWLCQEVIKYFRDHAMKHFAEEEVYMASIDYQGFEMHKRIHDDFRKKTLPALEKELTQTRYSADAVNHFLGVCAGWLIGHTLTEDRAITGRTISRWSNLLPEEEQAAMKQTIIQLLNDLFRLKSRLISESYGGEKFGNGIYYRLVYSAEYGKEWETVLVFEEKLLMSTIGQIMGSKTDQLNTVLVNASRYAAKQFVNCINERFPSEKPYEIKEENLLTYEQFQQVFERENPQFSLLFDTGEGYFAYCAIAPHLLDDGIGTPILAENAMNEVKKYVEKEKPVIKKKLLIVDDSSVMLQAMKELLSPEYEVSLAKSGMAAIRCITLDRPNLILLDYEMPVCDGRQTLEMIRSEEDFIDIPVIFLTGRSDAESIRNVMSLKPAGYLLKSLKPEDIKKNVNEFFEKQNR